MPDIPLGPLDASQRDMRSGQEVERTPLPVEAQDPDAPVHMALDQARERGLRTLYGGGWREAGEQIDQAFATDGPPALDQLSRAPETYGRTVGPPDSADVAARTLWAREQVLAQMRGDTLPETFRQPDGDGDGGRGVSPNLSVPVMVERELRQTFSRESIQGAVDDLAADARRVGGWVAGGVRRALGDADEIGRVVAEPYDYLRTAIDIGHDLYKGEFSVLRAGAQVGAMAIPLIPGSAGRRGGNLLADLAERGVKHTPENVIAIGRNIRGDVIFLETGTSNGGLAHILKEHASDFANRGISESQIPEAVFKAATQGTFVRKQGTRSIFDVELNDRIQRIAVDIGSNGFIVGANPAR